MNLKNNNNNKCMYVGVLTIFSIQPKLRDRSFPLLSILKAFQKVCYSRVLTLVCELSKIKKKVKVTVNDNYKR